MKIKNNTACNLSVGSLKTRGAASKNYMVVVGESTLELDDSVWLEEFAEPSAPMLKAGTLEIVKAPVKSDEQEAEEAEAALEAARALIAKADAKVTKKATTKAPTTGK